MIKTAPALSKSWRAKRVEVTAARRQNASVQLQAIVQKAGEARLRSCTSRGSTAMATIDIAPASCNS